MLQAICIMAACAIYSCLWTNSLGFPVIVDPARLSRFIQFINILAMTLDDLRG